MKERKDFRPPITAYRMFLFDQGRCLRRTELIDGADDQDAIAGAIRKSGLPLRGWSVEVWYLARRVFARHFTLVAAALLADLSDGRLDRFGLL